MNSEAHQKVQAEHLSRNAFLYVRQSTPRQVRENVESTKRQYALRDQAIALGVGLGSRLWSLTVTKDSRAAVPSHGKDSRSW